MFQKMLQVGSGGGQSLEQIVIERLKNARSGINDATYPQYFDAEIGKKYLVIAERMASDEPNIASGGTVNRILFNTVNVTGQVRLKAFIIIATATRVSFLGQGNNCYYMPLE